MGVIGCKTDQVDEVLSLGQQGLPHCGPSLGHGALREVRRLHIAENFNQDEHGSGLD